jgi:hypothetical protein
MTAGWRRGTFPSTRRPTRRVVALIAGAIVFAIVVAQVAADVVDSGKRASRVAAQTYVAEVVPVIDESTMLASTVHLVRDRAVSLARMALEADLGSLVAETSANLAQLGSFGEPAPTARSQELLRATLVGRALAARLLTGAIALAIGPKARFVSSTGARAAKLIVEAAQEMGISDRDYGNFVSSLPRTSGRDRLPASRWVTHPASWTKASVTSWVARLSSTPALQIRDELSIVAITVQPPVVRITGLPTTTTLVTTASTSAASASTSTTTLVTGPGTTTSSTTTSTSTTSTSTTLQLPPMSSTSVLPPTQKLAVVLVIANSGNIQISDIWAAASVVPDLSAGGHSTSGARTHSTVVRIGLLEPGASVEVILPALGVVAGDTYRLWAAIGTGSLPRGPVTSQPEGVGQIDEVRIKVASG